MTMTLHSKKEGHAIDNLYTQYDNYHNDDQMTFGKKSFDEQQNE